MADELAELDYADKIILKTSIDQISTDTPMTEVGVARIKKLIPKLSQTGGELVQKLVVAVATEGAKAYMGIK
jgi:hypothetical protein